MIRAPRVPRALFDWLTLSRAIVVIAVVLAVYGGYGWSAYRRGGMEAMAGVVGWGVLVAFVLAAPMIALVAGYFGWVEERVWAPWQGVYHAFDDHQVRVTEARGTLWFSSADVHAALGLSSRPAVSKALRAAECRRDDALGDVLSTAGLAAVFGRSTDRRTLRLLAWAERDVHRPWRNRRDRVKVDYAMRPAPSPPAAPGEASPSAPVVGPRIRPIDR